jgi:hypothetical protein
MTASSSNGRAISAWTASFNRIVTLKDSWAKVSGEE